MFQELPKERPATFDEKGKRVYLYPSAVRGRFRNLKQIVHGVLIIFFLVLPWIRINGKQALFLNVSERSFSAFGLFFRAHDAPLLFFLFLGFALSIAFVTALWGRIWCGWTCPQTVFIEGVFRRIENWIEGDHLSRRALDQAPWNFVKTIKKGTKCFIFLIVAMLITHSFLAYFVGSHEVLHMVLRTPTENWGSFLIIVFTTGIILFDFGWFREQFCVVMCPYGRFQSTLMDENSLTIIYDTKRGEPRRGEVPVGATQGDCVNCFRCVQVCPTGIDIRRGVQMECIACTACIDACDEVMTKVHKPMGLIRYSSQAAIEGKQLSKFQPRTFIYIGILLIAATAFVGLLRSRELLEIAFLRAKDIPYQVLPQSNGHKLIINHFVADLSNQSSAETLVDIKTTSEAAAQGFELIMPSHLLRLAEREQRRVDFFIRFPLEAIQAGKGTVILEIVRDGHTIKKEDLTVVAPNQ